MSASAASPTKKCRPPASGLALTLVLMSRKFHGAILVGIFGTALVGILRGITNWPSAIFAMPHPSSTFLQLDFRGAEAISACSKSCLRFCSSISSITLAHLVGVCEQGGFIKDGKIPRVGRVLLRMP